jgi:hypothetical protein
MKATKISNIAFWILKANLVTWMANAVIFLIIALLGIDFGSIIYASFFSKITLAETGIALVVAGGLAFSDSALSSKAKEQLLNSEEKWSIDKLRASEKKANKFIFLSLILFLECVVIAFLGF